MSDIAKYFGVSIDAVVYAMRKNKLPRRTFSEANKVLFEKKKPSFQIRGASSIKEKELHAAGAMLYWAEGHKSDKSGGIDFANSDPEMIRIFMSFLRSAYTLDEKRFRAFIYCYANQNISKLAAFWSRLTGIPKRQFTKPYIRDDFRQNGRVMQYGMIHVRYSDKKLLIDLKKRISEYKMKFLRRSDSGYSSRL